MEHIKVPVVVSQDSSVLKVSIEVDLKASLEETKEEEHPTLVEVKVIEDKVLMDHLMAKVLEAPLKLGVRGVHLQVMMLQEVLDLLHMTLEEITMLEVLLQHTILEGHKMRQLEVWQLLRDHHPVTIQGEHKRQDKVQAAVLLSLMHLQELQLDPEMELQEPTVLT